MILAFLGVGYALVTNILKQSEASNTAVPIFNLDNQVATEGTELYQNINKEKYGDINSIKAAKGELLITLKPETPLYEIAIIANQYNMDILERFEEENPSFRLRLSSVTQEEPTEEISVIDINQTDFENEDTIPKSDGTLETIWEELDNNPNIEYAELNAVGYLSSTPWGEEGYWPNDPDMQDLMPFEEGLWKKDELRQIDAHRAWQKLDDKDLNPGGSSNVWVATIDTGADLDHPDLAANIARDSNGKSLGRRFVSCVEGKYKEPCQDWIDFGGESGGDGIDNDNNGEIDDHVGHGTGVGGIIAEVGNNSKDVAGIGFNIKILPLIVTNLNGEGTPDLKATIQALNYASSFEKVKVINLSPYFSFNSIKLNQTINKVWEAKKIIVMPAGNDNQGDYALYPCNNENIICVASLDSEDHKAESSNYGPWIDVSAYGDYTYTTDYNNSFTNRKGTCFAAPLVSGSIALLYSMYPTITQNDARDITIQRASTIYKGEITEGTNGRGQKKLGCGMVNAGNMLTSKAPIFREPDCISKFEFKDIILRWKPFPYTNKPPDSYRLHWYKYTGVFEEPWAYDGIDIGVTDSYTLKSDDAEMFKDGDWVYLVGAWYPDDGPNGTVYWSSPRIIRKETRTIPFLPTNYSTIKQNEYFHWLKPNDAYEGNPDKYIALLVCGGLPNNPDPLSGKWQYGWLTKFGGDKASYTLDAKRWDILHHFASKMPSPMHCAWAVTGTNITDEDKWWGLDFSMQKHFYVPND